MTDTVLLSIDGPRATITLNDPAKHNRLDPAGLSLLRQAIEKADFSTRRSGDGDHRRGREDLLLGLRPGLDPRPARRRGLPTARTASQTVMDRLETMQMPTLCALNGGVYGGATDMALACDFRLGVKGMRFFMPAARFGLHYYPSGLRRYTQKVSPSFAKRAFLLSEDFSDEALLRVGYLDWLVERTELRGEGRRDRGKHRRPGAALDSEHEACHRAIRAGRARHPPYSRRHPRMPDFRRPARGADRVARAPAPGLQRPVRTWLRPRSVASRPLSTPTLPTSPD